MKTNNTFYRFSDFVRCPKWKGHPLSHFLKERKEKSDGIATVHSVSLQYGLVNQVDYLGRNYAAEDTSNYKLVYPNDVVYTKSPTGAFPYGIIKQNRNPYKVIVSPLYGVFKPINKYIGYIIQSYFEVPNRLNKYLSPIIQKGAKNTINISNSTFISREVVLPENEQEQKKIAQYLASINTQIRQQQKQIDVLIQHKKALLQQLFPQRGQSTPLLRYFIGSKKKWHYVEMRKVAILRTKRNVNNSKKVMTNSANYGIIMQQDYFERNIVDNDHLQKYYIVENGDFVYNSRISVTAPVGPISKNYLATGVISPLYMVFRFNIDKDDFYVYYFQSEHWQVQLKRIANNGARFDRMSISPSDFFNIKVPVPSAEEREYISKLFISIDNLINNMQQKVDLLMLQKKGLLQKLFPN